MKGPKIAPNTLAHTGLIVQQWESKREKESENTHTHTLTQHGWREEGKVQKEQREEEKAA